MSNIDDFFGHDSFSAHGLRKSIDKLRTQIDASRQTSGRSRRTLHATIDQLEVDIGRTLLKVHAITELLIDKGVVSAEELAAKAKEIDALDGAVDGALHPALFRTDAENEAIEPDFLTSLEKQDLNTNPKDFLAQLEKEEE